MLLLPLVVPFALPPSLIWQGISLPETLTGTLLKEHLHEVAA